MIDPFSVLVKTAINYVAFKSVKSSVDYFSGGSTNSLYQSAKAAKCVLCLNIWSNAPESCPHCGCKVFKKLYREYDYKKEDGQNGFEINSHLTIEENYDRNRR